MKIRQRRGGLDDAMATVEIIEPTRESVAAWAERVYHLPCPVKDLVIKSVGYDLRINWDTYLISLKGYGVLGMSDGPVSPLQRDLS